MEVGQRLSGTLIVGARSVALEDISGVYLRPQDTTACAALDDALLTVADLAAAVVLNRPDAMAANTSKPYQYAQIRAAGFSVPDTLITTSPDAARAFVAQHGSVIYKSVSGVRSVVGELREADSARLSEIRWCPTQLQQRIRGVDVRVHVVGDARVCVRGSQRRGRLSLRASQRGRRRAVVDRAAGRMRGALSRTRSRGATSARGDRFPPDRRRRMVLLRDQSVARLHVLSTGDGRAHRRSNRDIVGRIFVGSDSVL